MKPSMSNTLSHDLALDPQLRGQAIAGINVKLGCSVLFALGSYALWPSSIEWWGFATHSIVLGLGAIALLIGAFRSMAKLRRVEQALATYQALGVNPKGSHMADDAALQAAGMMDAPPSHTVSGKTSIGHRLRQLFGGAS